MKKIMTWVAIVLIALFSLAVTKDMIVKAVVENGVEAVTGLQLSMGMFRVGIIHTVVDIARLKLYNPPGFADRLMADAPRIYVDYDLQAALKGDIHLKTLILNVREFVVVKNAQGVLNLDSLKVVQAEKEGRRPAEEKPGKAKKLRIDNLRLTIGKVIYKDYSSGSTPRVMEFDLNIDESFTNLDDAYSVVSIVVTKALMNTSIAALTGFDLRGLQGTIAEPLASAQKTVSAALATTTAAMGNVGGVANTAQQTVTEAAGAVTNLLSNPFGSKKK